MTGRDIRVYAFLMLVGGLFVFERDAVKLPELPTGLVTDATAIDGASACLSWNTLDGTYLSVVTASGSTIWARFLGPDSYMPRVRVLDGAVAASYVVEPPGGPRETWLRFYGRDGTLQWMRRLGPEDEASGQVTPSVLSEAVVVPTATSLVAFERSSGRPLWSQRVNDAIHSCAIGDDVLTISGGGVPQLVELRASASTPRVLASLPLTDDPPAAMWIIACTRYRDRQVVVVHRHLASGNSALLLELQDDNTVLEQRLPEISEETLDVHGDRLPARSSRYVGFAFTSPNHSDTQLAVLDLESGALTWIGEPERAEEWNVGADAGASYAVRTDGDERVIDGNSGSVRRVRGLPARVDSHRAADGRIWETPRAFTHIDHPAVTSIEASALK